jgi:hypothetical protein
MEPLGKQFTVGGGFQAEVGLDLRALAVLEPAAEPVRVGEAQAHGRAVWIVGFDGVELVGGAEQFVGRAHLRGGGVVGGIEMLDSGEERPGCDGDVRVGKIGAVDGRREEVLLGVAGAHGRFRLDVEGQRRCIAPS